MALKVKMPPVSHPVSSRGFVSGEESLGSVDVQEINKFPDSLGRAAELLKDCLRGYASREGDGEDLIVILPNPLLKVKSNIRPHSLWDVYVPQHGSSAIKPPRENADDLIQVVFRPFTELLDIDPSLCFNLIEECIEENYFSRIAALRFLLTELTRAHTDLANEIRTAILRSFDPDDVLRVAKSEFELDHAENWLVYASAILESFGEKALPTLRGIAKSDDQIAEYFVGSIAQNPFLDTQTKLHLLTELARSLQPGVREKVFNEALNLDQEHKTKLLKNLLDGPHDDVTEEVRHELVE